LRIGAWTDYEATMKLTWLLILGLAACADERAGGDDVLPKRGERTTDPTIVSASASCEPINHTTDGFAVTVNASDPGGLPNLGTCAATVEGATREANFTDGGCYAVVERPCTRGVPFVLDVLVANKTGGFTQASTTITPR
jgi:hypothetical protein